MQVFVPVSVHYSYTSICKAGLQFVDLGKGIILSYWRFLWAFLYLFGEVDEKNLASCFKDEAGRDNTVISTCL